MMQPLRNYVFVKQDPEHTHGGGIIIKTSSGIVESQKQFGRKGTVTAVGPDVDKAQLAPGHRVIYGEFEFRKTPNGDIVIQDEDICGVIEDEHV